jgi:ribonucleoside-triphosphate reductase (thioredoxin)
MSLSSEYQKYIHTSRYARWLEEEGRRETWDETVGRYVGFFGDKLKKAEQSELVDAIYNLDVVPSMRAMMTAGKALERDNVAGFNCSYLPINHIRAFDELMYILLCGTGVGFSVERQYIQQLPEVSEDFYPTETTVHVADSKIGWAKAFREVISLLYQGQVPKWDVSRVRGAGERLKTFGGRASGPQPLIDLFLFACDTFKGAAGRRLSSIECHDLCCKIAEVIVVGGVRRSALISLSNPSDGRLRGAKSGQWWLNEGHRALANNSACYTERPEFDFFLDEMRSLYESKSGERGIFSRTACQKIAARNGRRDAEQDFGTNPCSEIILRPNQFCNLSEVVVRAEDTLEELKEKVRKATILGTLQSTLTDFRYLRPIWKKNTEEEALLGVSLTGIMDHPILSGLTTMEEYDRETYDLMMNPGEGYPPDEPWHKEPDGNYEKFHEINICNFLEDDDFEYEDNLLSRVLTELKEVAIETNKTWARRLGINPSAAITCVKPSGTVSQLVNSSSGIHPRFSPYYIRTVRADEKDPLAKYMVEAGFPYEVDVHKTSTLVFAFPVQSPASAVCTKEVGALGQLALWKVYQDYWCEHKPSITVYYKDEEFFDICSWVWKNFDSMSGISLLPHQDAVYQQAPYQEITEDQYLERVAAMPIFDWAAFAAYEHDDNTTSSQELACVGGACEL